MKFLVWGWKGWIGEQVMTHLKEAGHDPVGAASRADDENAVAAELDSVKPDRSICLIGRTRGGDFLTIDYLEQKGKIKENVQDNLWGPIVIAYQSSARGIHTTYMGTGCIFHFDEDKHKMADGSAGVGFTEDDNANFFGSAYSVVKGFTDRLMRMMFATKVLNVRIRMPITPDDSPYNFITKIVNYDKVVNIPNSMTVLPALIPVMCDLSVKETPGTVNLTHPGAISHNEVLALYKKHVDPEYTWQNFTIEEQDKILLSARSNNLLATDRLKALAPGVDDIHTAVEKVCIEMGKRFPKGIKKPKAAAAGAC